MSNSLKYIYIGNLLNERVYFEEIFIASQNISQIQSDGKKIFQRLSSIKEKKFHDRSKVPSKQGNYYFTCLEPDRFYFVLVENTINENEVFDLIDEINSSNGFEKINNNGEVLAQGKEVIKGIIDKFNSRILISSINNDVNDIKLDIKDNIRSLVTNKENIEELKERSEEMKGGAEMFYKNANEAKKISCFKNFKLMIIIILIIIGVLIVVIVPIVVSSNKSSSSENEKNTNSTRLLLNSYE